MKATVVGASAAAGTLLLVAIVHADPFCGVPHNPPFPPFSGEIPRFVGPGCRVPLCPPGAKGAPGAMGMGPGSYGAGPGGMAMGAGPGPYGGPAGMGAGPGGYGFGPGPYAGSPYGQGSGFPYPQGMPYQQGMGFPYQPGMPWQPQQPWQPQMPMQPQMPWQPQMPASPTMPHAGFLPAYPMYGFQRDGAQPPMAFPTHPYVRAPRDFFMWQEGQEDLARRENRPNLVP